MLTLSFPDQICNSPYCQPYNSYNISLENLVLDQLIIPKIDIFLYSHHLSGWYCTDTVRRNSVLSSMGVKGWKKFSWSASKEMYREECEKIGILMLGCKGLLLCMIQQFKLFYSLCTLCMIRWTSCVDLWSDVFIWVKNIVKVLVGYRVIKLSFSQIRCQSSMV